jgi:hypothetical protein
VALALSSLSRGLLAANRHPSMIRNETRYIIPIDMVNRAPDTKVAFASCTTIGYQRASQKVGPFS